MKIRCLSFLFQACDDGEISLRQLRARPVDESVTPGGLIGLHDIFGILIVDF